MVYTGNRHANKVGAASDVEAVCVPSAEEVSQRQGGGREPSRLSGHAHVFGHPEEKERSKLLNAPM